MAASGSGCVMFDLSACKLCAILVSAFHLPLFVFTFQRFSYYFLFPAASDVGGEFSYNAYIIFFTYLRSVFFYYGKSFYGLRLKVASYILRVLRAPAPVMNEKLQVLRKVHKARETEEEREREGERRRMKAIFAECFSFYLSAIFLTDLCVNYGTYLA